MTSEHWTAIIGFVRHYFHAIQVVVWAVVHRHVLRPELLIVHVLMNNTTQPNSSSCPIHLSTLSVSSSYWSTALSASVGISLPASCITWPARSQNSCGAGGAWGKCTQYNVPDRPVLEDAVIESLLNKTKIVLYLILHDMDMKLLPVVCGVK